MGNVQSRWAQGRRKTQLGALMAAGLIALVMPGTAAAQTAPAQAGPSQQPGAQGQPSQPSQGQPSQPSQGQPSEPQGQAPPGITFDSDAGILIMYVKADKTSEFETAMARLHEALAKTDKPERKQQAASWKLFKAAEPGPDNNVMYVHIMSPVLKGADYNVTKILYEVFPTEVQQIFPLLRDSLARGMGKLSLTQVQDFSAPAAPSAAPSTTGSGTPGQAGSSTPGAGTGTTGGTTPPSTPTPPRQ